MMYNKDEGKGANKMDGRYDAVELAAKVISIVHDNGMYITNLQLQKVMYYIQGEFMKKFNYKAFVDPIECWPYGPVIKRVWRVYNSFGRKPINTGGSSLCLDVREESCIKKIIKEKLKMNVWDLVDQTHAELPWKHANEIENPFISDSDMEEYFCR